MSGVVPEPVAAESRMVSAPGGQVHVTDYPGDEPTLVVMHGFPDDSRIYGRLAPLLSPRRVVAMDWLGYGRSDRPEPGPFDSARHRPNCLRCSTRLGLAGWGWSATTRPART